MNATADPVHLPALDGLRGLAAAAVVLSHLDNYGFASVGGRDLGHYGVMIFFVLSGFLMGHLYLAKPFAPREVARYAAARIARIVPIYYVTVLAGFAIYQLVDADFVYRIGALDLARLLLFVGNVSIFWSIGPEFQFYALFLLLWWAVAALPPLRERRLVALGAAAIFVFLVQARFPGVIVFSKLHIFLLGIGAAVLHRAVAPRLAGSRLVTVLQIAGIGFLLALLLPGGTFGETIYTSARPDIELNVYYADLRKLGLVALTVFALSLPTGWTRAVFANGAMRALGNASFSIYLLHLPVLYWLARTGLAESAGPYAGTAIALIAVFAVGTLSFRAFERPVQKRLRGPLAAGLERRLPHADLSHGAATPARRPTPEPE